MKARYSLIPSIGLILACVSSSGPVHSAPPVPGLDIDFRTERYVVSGDSWPEIWRSIYDNMQLITDTGERYEGVTEQSVALGPEDLVRKNLCTSQSATLALKLVVKTPRLPKGTLLAQPERECWALYDRSLMDHEGGHVTIAANDMRTLMQNIRSMPDASCTALSRLTRRHLEEMKRHQIDYDAQTVHGLEQWKAYGAKQRVESVYVAQTRQRCYKKPG